MALRIVQANAVYDPSVTSANALLDLYHTLTEWSAALTNAGAEVSVVQRFHTPGLVERDGVRYEFVADRQPPWLLAKDAPETFIRSVVQSAPDVVHVNGLIFPQVVAALRAAAPATVIVAQHHGGEFPVRGSGLVGWWRRQRWRAGLAAADAVSFTAREQAEPWQRAGVLGPQRVLEIVESGTTLRIVPRARARAALELDDTSRIILWVGRLTTNKDPLTVLDGLERALPALPETRMVMVFGDDTLRDAVDDRVRGSAVLADRVILAGQVLRDELPNYYAAADVFVSGSHDEGSGYALIEAMAAGVVPVVTDIPSFRAIAGDCGARWPVSDAAAFADALTRVMSGDLDGQRAAVRAHYARGLEWSAIASHTLHEYQALVEARRRAT